MTTFWAVPFAAGRIPPLFASYNFDDVLPVLLAVVVALLIVRMVIVKLRSKKRIRELQSGALLMGYTFDGEGTALLAQIGDLPVHLFSIGTAKIINNVLRGPGVVLFDYQHTTIGGRSKYTTRQTVAGFSYPGATIPQFRLGPEHWWNKVTDGLISVNTHKLKLIHFDSNPTFSKRFHLRGPDEPAIHTFFAPPLLTYLESLPEKSAWTVEGAGSWLIVYVHGHLTAPAALRAFADETSAIAAQIASNAGTRLTAG